MGITIECRPNGPYLVKGLVGLTNSRGESVATEGVFALCRCGHSANKPFCDGTHKTVGFSGARVSDGSNDKLKSYSAPGITIYDNRSICAHAGYCSDGLAAVFREEGTPWIDPHGGSVQAIVETIRKCPSGALRCTVDGLESPVDARAAKITITKDGPYAIVGSVELLEARWAEGASQEHYTLCRCGASKNKPFCDGAHWSIGFHDDKN